jgi:hypothetical protein
MSERTEVDGSYTVTLSDEQLSSIGFELDRIRDRMIPKRCTLRLFFGSNEWRREECVTTQ